MLRNGFWYHLKEQRWVQQRFPPHSLLDNVPDSDALHLYRGRPTFFGSPFCSENGDGQIECRYTEINQYDPDLNDWVKLGDMLQGRGTHEVIEVPLSFCPDPPVTVEGPVQTKVKEIIPTQAEITTVAMIIGGSYQSGGVGEATLLSSVELIGCPDDIPIDNQMVIDDFPFELYLTAAVYYEGMVMLCGGGICLDERRCPVSDSCWEWTPDQQWVNVSYTLPGPKWAHAIDLVVNPNSPGSDPVPFAYGYLNDVYIFNPNMREWETFTALPAEADNWSRIGCMAMVGDFIYRIKTTVQRINIQTWVFEENYDDVPDKLANAGRTNGCDPVVIEGVEGKRQSSLNYHITYHLRLSVLFVFVNRYNVAHWILL